MSTVEQIVKLVEERDKVFHVVVSTAQADLARLSDEWNNANKALAQSYKDKEAACVQKREFDLRAAQKTFIDAVAALTGE